MELSPGGPFDRPKALRFQAREERLAVLVAEGPNHEKELCNAARLTSSVKRERGGKGAAMGEMK